MQFQIPSWILNQMRTHAETVCPEECCGIGLAKAGTPFSILSVIPCRNVQSQYHAQFPSDFRETSNAAFLIDPLALLEIQKRARTQGECISLIYHSHIETPAVFSMQDRAMALRDGQPLYPQAGYLIFSIDHLKVVKDALYLWDQDLKEFVRRFYQVI